MDSSSEAERWTPTSVWPDQRLRAVASLLVELGRGVADGTGTTETHRLHFAGHIRRIENVTLVAEVADRIVGVVDMEYHQRLSDHRRGARAEARLLPDGPRDGRAGAPTRSRSTNARDGEPRRVVREAARRRRRPEWHADPRRHLNFTSSRALC
jgi:hypothetical protein